MALNELIRPTDDRGDIARALNKWATSKTQDPTNILAIFDIDESRQRL